MNLLAGTLYDPAVAVSKATTAAIAMTAVDTTNLRLTFTVPLSGKVYVRVAGGALHGATTYPQILVGILNGASVVARQAPTVTISTAAATTFGQVFTEFLVGGLTPGASLTWDLAYGVETLVASTGWKYGGPNNTTANDAFGGISFSIWDPSPIYLSTVMPSATVQANQTTSLTNEATIAGYIDTEVAAIKAKTDQLSFTTANKVDATIQTAGDFAQGAADKVWSSATRTLTSFGTLAADVWAVATRTLTAISDSSGVTTLLSRLTSGRATNLDNLDAAVSSRSTYAGGAVTVAAGGITATSFGVGAIDAAALATDAGQEIADRILTRALGGGSDTGRTVRQALASTRNKVEVVGSTLTVYAEDDSTVLYTATVTTAAGNPITAIDPT